MFKDLVFFLFFFSQIDFCYRHVNLCLVREMGSLAYTVTQWEIYENEKLGLLNHVVLAASLILL